MGQTAFRAKLNPVLSQGAFISVALAPASSETVSLLPAAPASGDEILFGKMSWGRGAPEFLAVVVNPKQRGAYGYIDLDRDGKFTVAERLDLSGGKARALIPVPMGMFAAIPAEFALMAMGAKPSGESSQPGVVPAVPLAAPKKTEAAQEAKPAAVPVLALIPMGAQGATAGPAPKGYLTISLMTTATADVDIGGQKTRFEYTVNLQKRTIDLHQGRLGVDCNGDGKIDTGGNVESAPANAAPVVFRIGKRYVSTRSVDINTGEVIVEPRPKSEYRRIELVLKGSVPDFAFRDLNGKSRKLSDYRGKYLLLDFWGSW